MNKENNSLMVKGKKSPPAKPVKKEMAGKMKDVTVGVKDYYKRPDAKIFTNKGSERKSGRVTINEKGHYYRK